jgi:hypothetical protein
LAFFLVLDFLSWLHGVFAAFLSAWIRAKMLDIHVPTAIIISASTDECRTLVGADVGEYKR